MDKATNNTAGDADWDRDGGGDSCIRRSSSCVRENEDGFLCFILFRLFFLQVLGSIFNVLGSSSAQQHSLMHTFLTEVKEASDLLVAIHFFSGLINDIKKRLMFMLQVFLSKQELENIEAVSPLRPKSEASMEKWFSVWLTVSQRELEVSKSDPQGDWIWFSSIDNIFLEVKVLILIFLYFYTYLSFCLSWCWQSWFNISS